MKLVPPNKTPKKCRGNLYMDQSLYEEVEEMRAALGYRSWNDCANALLRAGLWAVEQNVAEEG
jgi:hypothetical protein